MIWLWTILGALLITVLLAFGITYYIVRPRLARKVNAGAVVLSRELHGRPPLLSSAASCEGCTDPNRFGLKGIGAIALTERALVFVAGSTEDTVVIPRESVSEVGPVTIFEVLGKTVRRARPMLSVTWKDGNGFVQRIAFTVDDPMQWAAAPPASRNEP
ncbi:MAG: hypothetical protein HQ526_02485 [Actinobacteria bacterium]|nr:hypothetical protein [Actinomycetota bacterium]